MGGLCLVRKVCGWDVCGWEGLWFGRLWFPNHRAIRRPQDGAPDFLGWGGEDKCKCNGNSSSNGNSKCKGNSDDNDNNDNRDDNDKCRFLRFAPE